MTADQDTALIAGQLADLTRKVDEMADQLKGIREGAQQAHQPESWPRAPNR
jgi:hypothetical protein